jgi:hypothetical protein
VNKEIKIIGDLKITKEFGGNPKHQNIFHQLWGCYCVRSTKETVLCNPPIEIHESYYNCGFWKKTKYEKIKDLE